MYKLFLLILLLQLGIIPSVFSQLVTPSNSQNYIYTLTPQTPVTSRAPLAGKPADSMMQTVQYFDGLGRPLESIEVGITPGLRDLVTPFLYDDYGREKISYLPYAATSGNSGAFIGIPTDTAHCRSFYSSGSGYSDIATDNYPRAVRVFENSPLNRVLEQGAPGYSWQPSSETGNNTTSGHTVKFEYKTNTGSEVLLWSVDNSNNCNLSSTNGGYYQANQLYVTKTTDENYHITREYKDKQGQVVLKTAINAGVTLSTYYGYDDFGLLRYVLPPKAVASLESATTLTPSSSLVRDLCYYYQYDERQRMVIKQLPGAGKVYMVYDQRDRLALSQDSNQRSRNVWQFTRYDALNRPVVTGELTRTITRDDLQADLNNKYTDTTPRSYGESRTASVTTQGYTENSYPIPSDGSITYQTATYYDTYDNVPGGQTFSETANISTYRDSEGSSYYYDNAKGLVTGQRVLGIGSTYLTTTNYYDDKSRVIQALSQNHLGGMDIVSIEYDFVGKVKQNNHYHTAGSTAVTSIQSLAYDHAGRQKQETLQLTGSYTLPSTVVSKLVYNELGQLVTKKLAGETKKADYRYNIRGWLTSINDPADLNTNGDLFGMKLSYDVPFGDYTSTAQFNGNISSMKWQTASIGGQKGYTFTYDSINRLRNAMFGEYSGSWSESDKYSEKNIGYDQNGNILCLQRRGWLASNQFGIMDNLSYYYKGNQLIGVNDANTVNNNTDFYDRGFTSIPVSTNSSTWEYSYDGNGNFTKDVNKGLVGVQYNPMNLPTVFNFGNNNRVEYSYTMAGTKLRKQVYTAGALTGSTDYVNAFVYENNVPSYLLFDEGRILLANGTGTPEYYLKDHLGNVRVAFTADGAVKQVNSYYPFGMNICGLTSTETISTKNKYLYNGKEYQEDFGLNLLDYGARFYDPVIGRWNCIDLLAEKSRRWTPYNYCIDNPVRFIDTDGMQIYFYMQDEQSDKYKLVKFYQLNRSTKEMFYGWASSKEGQSLLQNFISGEQTFSIDKNNSLTIKGNGNNFDAQYAFGSSSIIMDAENGESTIRHGSTSWSLNNGKTTMTIQTDINNQDYEDQIMTFGHENLVHVKNDIDKINSNYFKGVGLTNNIINQINSSESNDHKSYNDKNSEEYKRMNIYLYFMKGWLGGMSINIEKKLEEAFAKEYLNNKNNVAGE